MTFDPTLSVSAGRDHLAARLAIYNELDEQELQRGDVDWSVRPRPRPDPLDQLRGCETNACRGRSSSFAGSCDPHVSKSDEQAERLR
jgi:hypothetical protein